jgi:hypothetical protein
MNIVGAESGKNSLAFESHSKLRWVPGIEVKSKSSASKFWHWLPLLMKSSSNWYGISTPFFHDGWNWECTVPSKIKLAKKTWYRQKNVIYCPLGELQTSSRPMLHVIAKCTRDDTIVNMFKSRCWWTTLSRFDFRFCACRRSASRDEIGISNVIYLIVEVEEVMVNKRVVQEWLHCQGMVVRVLQPSLHISEDQIIGAGEAG